MTTKYPTLTIRLPQPTLQRVQAEAERLNVSMAHIVKQAIEQHLAIADTQPLG